MYVDAVDVNVSYGVEMMLSGLAEQPSIGKSARNGVDYTSNLLSGFVLLLLLRLTLVSLEMTPLSSSFFHSIALSVGISYPMMVVLVPPRRLVRLPLSVFYKMG